MKTGSIKIERKPQGSEQSISVEIVNEENKTIGFANLVMTEPNPDLLVRWEKIVKTMIKE